MRTAVLLILFSINLQAQEISIDSVEQFIFNDLNEARKDPHAYLASKTWGDGEFTISKRLYKSKQSLILDSALSNECRKFAELLSNKKTLFHSRNGMNESISYTMYYYAAITNFITEFHSDTDGHRRHLLGQDNSDTHVGIGVAIDSEGLYYIVIRTFSNP